MPLFCAIIPTCHFFSDEFDERLRERQDPVIHEVLRHLLFSGLQFYFLVVILIQKTTFTIVPYIISPEMSDVFCLLTKINKNKHGEALQDRELR